LKGRDPLFWFGVSFLALLALGAVAYPLFGPSWEQPIGAPFQSPGGKALLGTDQLGRDILARLMYGARSSLTIGLTVQVLSLAVGIIFGVIGVYGPKLLATIVLRFADAMFAFPDILLAMLIIAVKGPGFEAVVIALSVTSWPAVTRLVFAQMSSIKDREFVVASRAMGASTPYLVWRHVLPQMWGILLAVSTVNLAGTILSESTLSFLGIGIRPPTPSWGNMIDVARSNMNSYPIQLVWPCLILSLAIFALNFVGDGLLARLDPRNR
jgi:ABC-type dipeptide/oligopeptide/nickel transport system permease subunit